MKQGSANNQQLLWARVVMRKWLNMGSNQPDYSADPDDDNEDDPESDSDNEECGKETRFGDTRGKQDPIESNEFLPKLRRQKSLTSRAQYINKKELRVCVGTWNVGGKLPPDDLDIDNWLDINEPADIYVLGLQEIVPLNPGNIFGAEDTRPVPKWENIIRDTLTRVRPKAPKIKSFSDPPSPSKFKPADDVPDIEEERLLESDSGIGEEIHHVDEEHNVYDEEALNTNLQVTDVADIANTGESLGNNLHRQFSDQKRLSRLNCLRDENLSENSEISSQQASKLSRVISSTVRIGLSWPEPPLHLLSQQPLDRPTSFKSTRSFKSSKSFRTCHSFKPTIDDIGLLADLEALMKRKRRSSYVRIVSKQMVGIYITTWVRRSLRKHIQNLKVFGVGVMGYIGNKGSISISMSMYQTLFLFYMYPPYSRGKGRR